MHPIPLRHPVRLVTLLLALILGAGLLVTPHALAAPPYETEATVSDLAFTEETVTTGSSARIEGSWSLPDDPATPAGFAIDLPEGLQGNSDDFSITSEDGETVGTCTVTDRQLFCDFDEDYLAENPLDLHGDFYFWVTVTTEVSETTETSYEFTDLDSSVSVDVSPNWPCTENCDFEGLKGSKWGWYDKSDESIVWYVTVPGPTEGMAGGEEITVSDALPEDLSLRADSIQVQKATELDAPGTSPEFDQTVPAEELEIDEDVPSVSWTAEQGAWYRVVLRTDTADGGAAESYDNVATVQVGTTVTRHVAGYISRQGGGGTGIGTDVGRFSLTKEVTGDAEIAADATFEVDYTVTDPNGTAEEGTATISAEEGFTSDAFPRGSTVTLEEVRPEDSAAVTWSDPVYSEQEFTLEGGTLTEVTVTNEAALNTATFEASKRIAGDGAEHVADDTSFEVGYTYPAGEGYPAGGGTLTLTADGTAVTSEELPMGAELSFTEEEAPSAEGAEWTGVSFEPSTLVVGDEDAAELVVTNEYALTGSGTPDAGGETSDTGGDTGDAGGDSGDTATPTEQPTTPAAGEEDSASPSSGASSTSGAGQGTPSSGPGVSVRTGGESASNLPVLIGIGLLLMGAVIIGGVLRRRIRAQR